MGSARPPLGGPIRAQARRLPVETIGRTDRLRNAPYQDLYWYEGRRPGLPWPSTIWRFEGAGAVASAADPSPHAEQAAAMAVDSVREVLSRRSLGDLTKAISAPEGGADLGEFVRGVMTSALDTLRMRAAAGGDDKVPTACSLLTAVVRGNRAAVAWVGGCAGFLVRGGECRRLGEDAGDHGAPSPPFSSASGASAPLRSVDFGIESGDVLVLASDEVAQHVHGPAEVGRWVADLGSLEEVCEWLLVEGRGRGSRLTNSVVILGIDLHESGKTISDPSRDPLLLPIAIRQRALPEGPTPEELAEREFRRQSRTAVPAVEPEEGAPIASPPAAEATTVSAEERGARASAPGPVEVIEPGEPARLPRRKPRNGGRRWVALGLVFVVLASAGALCLWQWQQGWPLLGALQDTLGVKTSPTDALAGPGPKASAQAPAAAGAVVEEPGEYVLTLTPEGSVVSASLGESAAGPIEVVIQEYGPSGPQERSSDRLEPGREQTIALPRSAANSVLLRDGPIRLRFLVEPQGGLAWASSARLSDLPRGTVVNLDDARAYLADRSSPVLLVVRVLGAAPGSSGGGSRRVF